MKRTLCVFIALAALTALFASRGPVLAYTVSGNSAALTVAGTVISSYTGSLAGLFSTGAGGGGIGLNNGTPYSDMYANQDYIVATSSSGAIATFSVGEIMQGGANVKINYNSGTGYTVSSPQQSLSNVTNFSVVHTTSPPGTYTPGGIYTTSFTIQGSFTPTGSSSFTPANFPGTFSTVTGNGSTTSTNKYTGVSLLSLLSQDGVKTSNFNQYVIATGSDGGETVLSMQEIVQNPNDMVAYLLNGSLLSSTRGYFRLVLPGDDSTSRSIFTLSSLTVEPATSPVPAPATLLFFGPGLVGLAALRRRFKK